MIDAKNKSVVVIGAETRVRIAWARPTGRALKKVTQIELLPGPRNAGRRASSGPKYPMILKTSSSHEEGGERHWSILTKVLRVPTAKLKK